MDKKKLQIIKDKSGGIIGHKFLCEENDNRIKFYHVDGDVDDGEFHFGHPSEIGGWTVIGKKDLFKCLEILEIPYKGVPSALNKLKETMQDDAEYAWGWHCNIAVAMQDDGISHKLSNKITTRIMKTLFEVDTKFGEPLLSRKEDKIE